MRAYLRKRGGGGGEGFFSDGNNPNIVGFLDGHNMTRLDFFGTYKTATW